MDRLPTLGRENIRLAVDRILRLHKAWSFHIPAPYARWNARIVALDPRIGQRFRSSADQTAIWTPDDRAEPTYSMPLLPSLLAEALQNTGFVHI